MKGVISVSFFLYVAIVILTSFPPLKLKPHPFLLKSLISGTDQGYIIPASELEPFKKYLPQNGFFSFLMDYPYDDHDEKAELREFFWKAQNYLVPIVLNRNPGETRAIIFCSNDAIAEKRLQEAGYDWLTKIGDGKGIAVRKQ